MKRIIAILCTVSIALWSAETETENDAKPVYGNVYQAGDASDVALGTSMVGWGLGLAAGIALLTGLISPSSTGTDSSAHSHAHSNYHTLFTLHSPSGFRRG